MYKSLLSGTWIGRKETDFAFSRCGCGLGICSDKHLCVHLFCYLVDRVAAHVPSHIKRTLALQFFRHHTLHSTLPHYRDINPLYNLRSLCLLCRLMGLYACRCTQRLFDGGRGATAELSWEAVTTWPVHEKELCRYTGDSTFWENRKGVGNISLFVEIPGGFSRQVSTVNCMQGTRTMTETFRALPRSLRMEGRTELDTNIPARERSTEMERVLGDRQEGVTLNSTC
ncbi:hypothetical protein BDW02DRAFT_36567 [Decorospora gaudefroyi]|uniref:Uncharacterized protein n=1 Tax=Decorospora gaudefroyi TaxID=184978 RepID=A0A6A5K2E6_9PLEO|nr:hypothetical protein BDW02DRAFT_36567 [Decorospora gaudefroyi]